MVNYCVGPCCKTKGGFKFPCEENLLKKWVSFVNKKWRFWSATPYSRICHNLHFTDDDFIDSINTKKRGNMRKNRLLKDCAVPTIFRYVLKFESPQLIRRRQREIMQTERHFKHIIYEIKEERDKQRLYTNAEIEVQCEITVDSICEDKTGNKNEVVLMAADYQV
ncbi:THAP domain-containing protein 9 [Plakobranchus ocellatus]|uniref:THAP domain-containing protein 9 n=1 Tax=Plakobranchus ocellatus TaxID=259542 RepID=A0AAV4AW08_9GAST|nr:THAP domain-containing protein 9 [Plakobranchus ocellatus]